MKSYTVIKNFTDLQDKHYSYHVGDIFPHEGLRVEQKRLDELSGNNNRQHEPLIEEVKPVSKKLEKPLQKEPPKSRNRRKNNVD